MFNINIDINRFKKLNKSKYLSNKILPCYMI